MRTNKTMKCKTSDLLPELQGRLPIRVELKALTEEDLFRILTEPEMNLIQQQIALMQTENIQLEFTHDAIKEMAFLAADVNRTVENIGARFFFSLIIFFYIINYYLFNLIIFFVICLI